MTTVALNTLAAALEATGLLRDRNGTVPEWVTGITDDSRAVTHGSVFVAVKGTTADGHDFVPEAIRRGASVVIVENLRDAATPALTVTDARRAAAIAASAFYGEPGRSLRTIGVTGTNGKTTTVQMLRYLLNSASERAASIGTLGVLVGSEGQPFPGGAGLTTPGPVEVQRVLRALVDAGVKTVAMEASSHALDQRRLDGVAFTAAVFTNLTRDHLDYHASMEAYFEAKAHLVSLLAESGTMIVNADDRAWDDLPPLHSYVTYGLAADAGVRAMNVQTSLNGSRWTLDAGGRGEQVMLPLLGDFNVSNALAAAAAAIALGAEFSAITARLATMPQVTGRLERLSSAPVVLRDYAHTPDALERALMAIRPFANRGRVIVVFGCGGDRDPGKRPIMGGIAERLADHVILTSDNPRTEDPEKIIDAIEAGMQNRTHERIEDRRVAIARAIETADRERDIVLLAGKGHETYQVRGKEKFPFDEAQIVRGLLAGAS
jgi:UDP-N-acetylmuramoyl-L-alanyl-D-glutamate--2,6-diaminopimelate ligase